MASRINNLVHETTTGTGTGNLTLASVNGKQDFNTVWGTGGADVFFYFISSQSAPEWEVGTGHLSASTTLVRDTVLFSSNAGSAVNFSAGTKDVVNDAPYNRQGMVDIQVFDASGTWTKPPEATTGNELVCIDIWDSGASGASRATTGSAGGGSGGCYHRFFTRCSALASTETITVGALVAGVSGATAGTASNRSSVTINGVTFTPTTVAATGGTTASGTTSAGHSTIGTISTVGSVQGEAGQASPDAAAPYVAATGTFMKAGQAGATACSTAANGGNGAGLGGTIFELGKGGVAGLNSGGNGGNGTAPGGGGGGAVQGGTSGSGAPGKVIITTFIQ